ncbi:MAG TPA: histidine kinase dimerization/phospho-acceptor domain-containing protein, partial [Archangium sp.]
YTNPNDLIAAINDGQVFRYVTKPWDLNDLMMTVRNALSVAQLRKEKERLVESLHKRVEALNVMYEVSRQSAKDAPSLDAIVDRLLATVGRVLPHDASAVLVESSDGDTAALRIRCTTALNETALLHVKDSILNSHRKSAGVVLPEEKVSTNVSGELAGSAEGLSTFACAISVPLVSEKQTVGTLALFSTRPDSYTTDDGELLDLLVNQTTDAITHVRAAERESRLRIEQMVEAMGDGVILTDAKGAVAVVNRAARELLSFVTDEARPDFERLSNQLGLSPFELVRGWEYGGQKTMREELKIASKDIELVVTPVAGTARELKGLVIVLRDVTEQKLLAQRKDEFVGIISHELRTPLTSIAGALDLVLNRLAGDVTEKQTRFLSMARESTERLNALVDDLLDLAKFEQGALSMNFQLMRLDELAKAAVERYGPAFAEKKIDVAVEGSGEVRLLADPNRLTQVVNNLLTNAVKFTPVGGSVKVLVGWSKESPGSAVLTVWNSGEVIAEADLDRIFDRFEQARSATTRNIPG